MGQMRSNLLNLSGLKQESLIDGVGLRTVIFFQGCSHYCQDCQNPHTWDDTKGNLFDIKYILNYIDSDKLSNGVTYSGGCPMCQHGYSDAIIKLSKEIKERGLSLWCYCGEVYEELTGWQLNLLPYIDVLMDGKFQIQNRDDTLAFRGSSNQRVIDVKKTLKYGKVIPFNE